MSEIGTVTEFRAALDEVRAEFGDNLDAMAREIYILRHSLRNVRRFTTPQSRAGQWARAPLKWPVKP